MKLFLDADSIMFKAACTQDSKYDTRVVTRKIIEDSIADTFADETYVAVKVKIILDIKSMKVIKLLVKISLMRI